MDARVPVICKCPKEPKSEAKPCTRCKGRGYVWVTATANREVLPFWFLAETQEPKHEPSAG